MMGHDEIPSHTHDVCAEEEQIEPSYAETYGLDEHSQSPSMVPSAVMAALSAFLDFEDVASLLNVDNPDPL